MKWRLTPDADADIAHILKVTKRLFGERQVLVYARIIERGIEMIADDPMRPASIEAAETRDGIRMFHLDHAARRRHGAVHVLYYKQIAGAGGEAEIIILRVLHEAMEPKRRLMRALRKQDGEGREPP